MYYNLGFDINDLPPGYDPAFSASTYDRTIGDVSSGVFFYGKNFYFGYSIINLLESSFNKEEVTGYSTNREFKHYYGIAGYRFSIIDNNWGLEPSILLRKINERDDIYDISSRIIYLNSNWIGITYRTDATIAFSLGISSGNIHLSYSYDYSIGGEIMQHTLGTHELLLSLKIPSRSSRRHITFWDY